MIRVGRGASAVAVLALVLSLVVALLVRADAGRAGVATHLEITAASSSIVAGTTLQLVIRAKDNSGAVDGSYGGDKTLTFSGINPSTNPANPPTVKDKNGIPQNVGDPTVITFAGGVATAGGELAAYLAEDAVIAATDGTITTSTGAGGGTFELTVTAGLASRLHIAGSGSQFAGTRQQLTITAIDGNGNTVPAYTGDKTLRFRHGITSSGPSDFGGAHATVTDKTGIAKQFSGGDNAAPAAPDNPVEITFTNGVSTAGGELTLVKAETVDISVKDETDGLSAEAGDWLTVTVNGTHLVITGSGTQTAGGTQPLTITAKDQSNATDTSYTGDHTLVFSGAGSSSSPVTAPTVTDKNGARVDFGTGTPITFTNGVATAGGVLKLTKAEAATIAASESGGPAATGADRLGVTVSAGALAKFALVLATPQTSATAFTGTNTLTAQDAYGNTVTTFDASADPVTIAAVAPLATLGSISGLHGVGGDQLNLAGDFSSGVANLTSLGLTYTGAAATGTFTATSTVTNKTGTSGSVVVTAPAPAKFVVTGTGTMTAGGSQTITVTAKTAGGATLTAYTGDHVLQFAGAAGSPGPVTAPTVTGTGAAVDFGSDTTLNFVAGVATATLRLYTVEAAKVGAGSTGESVAMPLLASGDRLSVTVSPGAAASFAFSLATPQVVGAPFTGTNTLTVKDAYGNVVTGFDASAANVTLSSTPSGTIGGIHGGAVLNQAGDFASGVADLTALGLTFTGTAGSTTFTATRGGVTGTSSAITVNAGAVTRFKVTGTATQAQGTSQTATVTALDAGGNTVTSYTGSHTLQFGGANDQINLAHHPTMAGIAFGTDTPLTFALGQATGSLALWRPEPALITAASSGESIAASSGTDRLSVTVQASIDLAASSVARSDASRVADGSSSSALSATVKDTFGDVVRGDTIRFSTSLGTLSNGVSSGATLTATTNASGIAQGIALSSNSTGTATVTVVDVTAGNVTLGTLTVQFTAVTPSCLVGTYALNGSCVAAPPGSYADATGLHPCPVGTFTSIAGSMACLACPAGTEAKVAGSSICTAVQLLVVELPLPAPTVTSITSVSATISWSALPDGFVPSATQPAPTSYSVQVTAKAQPASSDWRTFTFRRETTFSLDSLAAGTQYSVRVAAINAAGTSPYSATTVFTTLAVAKPKAPTGLKLDAVTTTTATVSWTAPATGPDPTGYVVTYSLAGSSSGSDFSVGCQVTDTSCTIGPLDDGATYLVRVAAKGDGGIGVASTPLRVTTSAATGSPVQNLKYTDLGGGKFTLTWDPPAGKGTYTYQTSYTQGGSSDVYFLTLEAVDTSFTGTNVLPVGPAVVLTVTSYDKRRRTATASVDVPVPAKAAAAFRLISAVAEPSGTDGTEATLTLTYEGVLASDIVLSVSLSNGGGCKKTEAEFTRSVLTCRIETFGSAIGATTVTLGIRRSMKVISSTVVLTGSLRADTFTVSKVSVAGQKISVEGTGFVDGAAAVGANVGGYDCTSTAVVVSPTLITCTISRVLAAGTSVIVAVTQGGVSHDGTGVVPGKARLTRVDPNLVTSGASGSLKLVLLGNYFIETSPGAVGVTLRNGDTVVDCPATWISEFRIECTLADQSTLKDGTYSIELAGVGPAEPSVPTLRVADPVCPSGTIAASDMSCVSTSSKVTVKLSVSVSLTDITAFEKNVADEFASSLGLSRDRFTIVSMVSGRRRGALAAVPSRIVALGIANVRATGTPRPGRTPRLVLRSPRIRPGDGAYAWTAFGLRPVAVATAAGSVTVPLTGSGTFVVLRLPAHGAGFGAVAANGSVQRLGPAAAPAFYPAGARRRIIAASSTRDASGGATLSKTGRVWTYGSVKGHGSLAPAAAKTGATAIAVLPNGSGYLVATGDGAVHAFGAAEWLGDLRGRAGGVPVVAILPNVDGRGYVLVQADGTVASFGSSPVLPGRAALKGSRVTGAALTRDGAGVLLVDRRGRVFALGSARAHGGLAGKAVVGDVVGIAPSVGGKGYTLVTAGGRAYRFGDARAWAPRSAPAASAVVAVVG